MNKEENAAMRALVSRLLNELARRHREQILDESPTATSSDVVK
jgi:hypothetical protein